MANLPGFGLIFKLLSDPNVVLTFQFLYYTAPIWVTFILAVLLGHMWLTYKRAQFFAKQSYTLLEIKLPKEIFKSPVSMEFLFNALYQPFGEEKWIFRWRPFKMDSPYYLAGAVRPWFSLELAAVDGKLRFFMWMRSGARNTIEAQLYSQFPGIEIFEVPDYTLPIAYDPEKTGMWGTEFELTKADPFPIKTYVDYAMDKDPKEEYRIDPMTPLVEFLGSLGPGHHAWIQIGITAHKATDKGPDGKTIDKKWAKGAEEEIQKILDKAKPPKPKEGETPASAPRSLTKGEAETIASLERSVSKKGFDTSIRAIYIAPKDTFNPANIGGIFAGMSHFNSNMNGFKGSPPLVHDWQKTKMVDAYKSRGFFYNEFKTKHFVLNTEELATIYHFPAGGVTTTPGFERISSRKSEAPSNLPM